MVEDCEVLKQPLHYLDFFEVNPRPRRSGSGRFILQKGDKYLIFRNLNFKRLINL